MVRGKFHLPSSLYWRVVLPEFVFPRGVAWRMEEKAVNEFLFSDTSASPQPGSTPNDTSGWVEPWAKNVLFKFRNY